jgi:acyl-CoA reductase-like NAD-dependent aldehyde dehydrogenase
VEKMDEEIEIIKRNKYGNGKEIFKKNGENERKLNKKIDVGKVGVNVKINVKMNMF